MNDSAFPILSYWLVKPCKSMNFIATYGAKQEDGKKT